MNASTNGQAVSLRPLGAVERAGIGVVAVLLAGLAGLGAVVSFASVEAAVEPSFGELAWTVPIGVDVGIFVFTALDFVMGRLGMRTRAGRLVPWALVATTIYLNVASESTVIGRVAHGVLPGLWVVAVEYAALAMRTWTGTGHATPGGVRRIDRVRLSRWLLDPGPTLRLWRRMRLWEIHDLTEGRRRDREQDLARAALKDRYGPLVWRWRAPRRERVLHRHGALAPTALSAGDDGSVASLTRGASSSPVPARRRGSAPRRNGTKGTGPEISADLLALGLRIDAEVTAEGRELTRDELVRRVRAELGSCSNAKGGALLARIHAERPGRPTVGAELVEVT
ncbi:MAG: DUF2637 domain-containing protein [Acidimicrobiales bacterium]